MATMEFVQKRIEGKEKELEKLNKKLERIYKAKESNWENNPYYYGEYDLRRTKREIEAAAASLKKYTDQLQTMQEKAASRNIPVIIEFLEMWKDRCREYYQNVLEKYPAARDEYKQKKSAYRDKIHALEKQISPPRPWTYLNPNNPVFHDCAVIDNEFKKYQKDYNSTFGDLVSYLKNPSSDNPEIDWNALNKDLDYEANLKYDFIIERTNAIVGTITDATGLYIANNGNLNGLILGDRGTAKVETIGAGGYNIQCFHFRTLIHEYDKKKKKHHEKESSFSR